MNTDILFLAAGLGSRLLPLTKSVPKALVRVHNIPIIKNQINIVKLTNIKNIHIVSGYMSEKINFDGVNKVFNKDFKTTNMVHSFFLALEEIINSPNDLIVSYSDIIYNLEILELVINSQKEISIVTDDNWHNYWSERFEDPLDDAETCKISDNNLITNIGSSTRDLNLIDSQYIGLMKFNYSSKKKIHNILKKEFINKFSKSNIINTKNYNELYMTDLLQYLIKEQSSLNALRINGGWLEIDSIQDLKIAEKYSTNNENYLKILR